MHRALWCENAVLIISKIFWLLAAERMSQAALVEAPRKAAAQQIETRAKAEIRRLAAEVDAHRFYQSYGYQAKSWTRRHMGSSHATNAHSRLSASRLRAIAPAAANAN
jgi:hypothetical protein